MSSMELVDALVGQCLRDIGNGDGRIQPSRAADWFVSNVTDNLNDAEWAELLRNFTDQLKVRGHLVGH